MFDHDQFHDPEFRARPRTLPDDFPVARCRGSPRPAVEIP